MRQLSGGERRRVALALALGFGDLVAQRGRLRCNLVVLDEVRRCNFTSACNIISDPDLVMHWPMSRWQ